MKKQQRHRVIFFGSPTFSVPSLEGLILSETSSVTLVVTQPDAPKGRSKMPFPTEIKKTAVKRSIPVIAPHTLKDKRDLIKKYGPFDIGVVVAYGAFLPEWLLTLPKHGVINVHPSLLPLLRGPSPIQSAIVRGEKITGISFILLDTEMDHGPILSQERTTIKPDDTYTTLSDRISKHSGEILPSILNSYILGNLKPKKQIHSKATFSKLLTKEDGKIDWHTTVQEIHDQIRGLNPWPGTYTSWNEKTLKILEASAYTREVTKEPGRVNTETGHIIVETANGTIEILRLQLEGKKPLSAAEFLNGHSDIQGSLLS